MKGTVRTRSLGSAISASTLALAMTLATPALAQSELATLQGHVDGAAAGAQVVAVDTNTGQRQVATVAADGSYTILGLRPSTYTISVEGRAEQHATLSVGQTATVDFVEETATSGQEVVVRGSRTTREVRTQTVSTNVTPAQIENLPQNQRNFLSFAELAPGVSVSRGGNAQIQAGGVSSSNVNVLLDGLSFKNPINHGGVFGQNFGLGNPFPQIAIQEYRIQTQNFGAEEGQAGSALLTAITKTGGREFHGSAFVDWQPKAFLGQPYYDAKRGVPKPNYDREQFGGELSGPIIPGTLSFYVGGEGTIESLPGAVGKLNGQFPANVTSQITGVPHSFDFKQGLYFGKLTWFATNADTINAQAFIRRENNLSDIDANAAPTHGRTILTHQDRYQLSWRHSAGEFLNQLNVAYDRGEQSTPSVGTGPEYVITRALCDTPNCVNFTSGIGPDGPLAFEYGNNADFAELGAHFFTQGDRQTTWTARDDATLVRGNHTFRAGGQVSFLTLQREVVNYSNGSFYYFNPGPTDNFDPLVQQPDSAQIATGASPRLKAKDTQIGLYVQDEWKPDEHWTFNLGLRWDFETNANNNNYVTPAAIADALRNYEGWKARGIDPEDYISNGHNRKPQYDEFQPRFGFAYDVKGDRDLVIFGGAGRYYDRSLFIEGAIETLTNSNYIFPVIFCAPGGAQVGGTGSSATDCANFQSSYLTEPDQLRALALSQGKLGGSVSVLNNKTRAPYSDQFDLGIRKKLGPVQVSLTLSHIRSHNIFQFVRANFYTNGWYTRFLQTDATGNVIGCTDGGDTWIQDFIPNSTYSACPAGGGQLSGFSGKLNRGSNRASADYNAIYFTVEKPFTNDSTWGVQSSLTIQSARTNDSQELNNDEVFNAPEQTAYGWNYVNGVEKWRLVTAANYRAPYGFTLSGQLSLSSGPSFGNVIFGGAPDGACCYGDFHGVFYPKPFIAYKRLDLRVSKTFKLPWGHEITGEFEAFNVFDWLNRTYSTWGAGSGSMPTFKEEGQVGNDSRSFQAGLKYSF